MMFYRLKKYIYQILGLQKVRGLTIVNVKEFSKLK
jgi:hypothetical protein